MDELGAILRAALAVTFVVSALSKWTERRGLAATATELGVPRRAANVLAPALPVVELGVALLLLPASTALLGGALSIGLLVAFTALLLASLARGRRPSCNCFGSRSAEPISWRSVLRNAVLLAAASVVVVGRPAPLTQAFDSHDPAIVALGSATGALTVAVGLLGWALTRLLRQHGRVLLRLDALEAARAVQPGQEPAAPEGVGLPVGTEAPDFSLSGIHGETMTLGALRSAGKPVLLVFSDPGCGPCNALAPTVAEWQERHADRLRIVVVGSGDHDANRAKAGEHGLTDVYVQDGTEVAEQYRYQGTPGAVLVGSDGRIAAPLATGAAHIESLVERTVGTVRVELGRRPNHDLQHHHDHHDHAPATIGLAVGEVAPPFELPIVGGGSASLEAFRGRHAVVLFWNPQCGFCESLLPDLLDWEKARSSDDPELLVVSTADEPANAAAGFSSTVFLDATSSTMSSYQANGTPMAVLVDDAGRIASHTGIGSSGVLDLLHTPRKAPA